MNEQSKNIKNQLKTLSDVSDIVKLPKLKQEKKRKADPISNQSEKLQKTSSDVPTKVRFENLKSVNLKGDRVYEEEASKLRDRKEQRKQLSKQIRDEKLDSV